jgi:hypothetical protein
MDTLHASAAEASAKWEAKQRAEAQARHTKALSLQVGEQAKEQAKLDAAGKTAAEKKLAAQEQYGRAIADLEKTMRADAIDRELGAQEQERLAVEEEEAFFMDMADQRLAREQAAIDRSVKLFEKAAADKKKAADKQAADEKKAADGRKRVQQQEQQDYQATKEAAVSSGLAIATSLTEAGAAAGMSADAQAAALATIAAVKALYEGAEAIASFASYRYAEGAQHAAAAIQYGVVAGTGYAGMGGGSGGGSAGGDGSATSGDAAGPYNVARGSEGGGPTTVIHEHWHVQGSVMGDRAAARYQAQVARTGRQAGMAR